MIDSICKELVSRKDYLKDQSIETIYFGGGTPSVLSAGLITQILQQISVHYMVEDNVEITLEANPEDINIEALTFWKNSGINRLSIGIQSFQDKRLGWMNRNHTAKDAIQSVKNAQAVVRANPEPVVLIFGNAIDVIASQPILYSIGLKVHSVKPGESSSPGTHPYITPAVFKKSIHLALGYTIFYGIIFEVILLGVKKRRNEKTIYGNEE